jgi:hypothetical protein
MRPDDILRGLEASVRSLRLAVVHQDRAVIPDGQCSIRHTVTPSRAPSRVTEAALKHENLRLDLGRRGALPGDPWQRDFRHIEAAPFKDAPRSIRRELDNRPISMEFDQSPAIDGP